LFSNPDIPDKIKSKMLEKFGDIFNGDMFSDLSISLEPLEIVSHEILNEDKDSFELEINQTPVKQQISRNMYELDRYMQSH